MTNKHDGPPLENRRAVHRKNPPQPPEGYGKDSAEVTPPSTPLGGVKKAEPKPAQVYVVQLNTRVAHPYKEQLQALSAERGTTIRHLIEQALDNTYGKPEGV